MKRNDFLGTEEPDEPDNPFLADTPKPAPVEPKAKDVKTLHLPKKPK